MLFLLPIDGQSKKALGVTDKHFDITEVTKILLIIFENSNNSTRSTIDWKKKISYRKINIRAQNQLNVGTTGLATFPRKLLSFMYDLFVRCSVWVAHF